jgi:hypothetical protein
LDYVDCGGEVLDQKVRLGHDLVHVVIVLRWLDDMFVATVQFFPFSCLDRRKSLLQKRFVESLFEFFLMVDRNGYMFIVRQQLIFQTFVVEVDSSSLGF